MQKLAQALQILNTVETKGISNATAVSQIAQLITEYISEHQPAEGDAVNQEVI